MPATVELAWKAAVTIPWGLADHAASPLSVKVAQWASAVAVQSVVRKTMAGAMGVVVAPVAEVEVTRWLWKTVAETAMWDAMAGMIVNLAAAAKEKAVAREKAEVMAKARFYAPA